MAGMRELADQGDFAFLTQKKRLTQIEEELISAMLAIRARGMKHRRGKVLPLTGSQTEFVAAMRNVLDERQKVKYLIEAEECRSMGLLELMSNSEKLEFYALFKQGFRGDIQKKKPGVLELVKLAKWEAWSGVRGMKREDARAACIEYVLRMKSKYNWRRPTTPLPAGVLCPSSAKTAPLQPRPTALPCPAAPAPAAAEARESPGPFTRLWARMGRDPRPRSSRCRNSLLPRRPAPGAAAGAEPAPQGAGTPQAGRQSRGSARGASKTIGMIADSAERSVGGLFKVVSDFTRPDPTPKKRSAPAAGQ
eukprot:tig00000796_g4230.t1